MEKSDSPVYKENLYPQISEQDGEDRRKMTLFFLVEMYTLEFPDLLHEGRVLGVIKRPVLISRGSSSLFKVRSV